MGSAQVSSLTYVQIINGNSLQRSSPTGNDHQSEEGRADRCCGKGSELLLSEITPAENIVFFGLEHKTETPVG